MSDVLVRPNARTLLLNPRDNVAVALGNLDVGSDTAEGVRITRRVPKGHKFAVRPIGAGEAVLKRLQFLGQGLGRDFGHNAPLVPPQRNRRPDANTPIATPPSTRYLSAASAAWVRRKAMTTSA